MKLAVLKLYVQVVFSGLVLLAALVLLVLQWGNRARFSLYGANKDPNTLLLMVCSAVGGVVVWWLVRMLLRGVVGLRRLRRAAGGAVASGGSEL